MLTMPTSSSMECCTCKATTTTRSAKPAPWNDANRVSLPDSVFPIHTKGKDEGGRQKAEGEEPQHDLASFAFCLLPFAFLLLDRNGQRSAQVLAAPPPRRVDSAQARGPRGAARAAAFVLRAQPDRHGRAGDDRGRAPGFGDAGPGHHGTALSDGRDRRQGIARSIHPLCDA